MKDFIKEILPYIVAGLPNLFLIITLFFSALNEVKKTGRLTKPLVEKTITQAKTAMDDTIKKTREVVKDLEKEINSLKYKVELEHAKASEFKMLLEEVLRENEKFKQSLYIIASEQNNIKGKEYFKTMTEVLEDEKP